MTIVSAIAIAVAVNAQPSWRSRTAHAAATIARSGITCERPGMSPFSDSTCVQIVNTTTVTMATRANGIVRRRARSWTMPVVRSVRNVDPCSRVSESSVMPTQMPYGVSRFQNEPVYSPFESIGSPYSRSPSATPNSTGQHDAADGERRCSTCVRQRGGLDLAAVLERHAADDQREQHEHEGEVERREPRRVPGGEGGEHRRHPPRSATPRCRPRTGRSC